MTNTTTEEKQYELLMNEETILNGVLGAVQDLQEAYETVEVARDGKVFFQFRVRPLSADEYEAIGERATTYKKNKRTGGKMVDKFSTSMAHALLIVEATHPEDRKLIWGNKEIWKQVGNVLTAYHLVPKVLRSGEIDAIVGVIDDVSGNSIDRDDMIAKEQEEIDNLKN